MRSERILSLLLVLCLLLCLAPCAALAEGTIAGAEAASPGNETQALDNGYYLVGSMNGWTPSAAYRFETNPGNSTEYMLSTTLTAGQELKVVQVEGGNSVNWYPGGDNYVVDADHAGSVNIYFKPEYNSGWSAFGGYFYIEVLAVEDPTYTVGIQINGAEPHGALSTDRAEAREGDTITVTVTPEEGYMLMYIEAPAITKVNDSTYTFPMPGYDTKVYANFKLAPGFYFDNTDRNVPDYYVPEEKFVPSSSPFGEWERETVLTEGKYLDVYAVYAPVYAGNKTGYCWCSNTMNHYYASWATQPKVSAEQAGHAMVFLTETEREGYIKAVHTQKTYIDPSFAWDAWIVIKNFHPIVVESAQGGAVTADLTEAIEGQTVTLTATPEEGYELESLTVADAEGNAIAVEENAFLMPDSPVTVTAAFKPEQEPTVALSFNAGEGAVDPAAKEVTVGEAVGELPIPTREGGWVFMGWYTEAADSAFTAGQGTQVTAETVLEDDTTVYAHWRLPGDINGDGKVNNKDWNLLLRYVKYSEGTVVEINVDVTGDGKVNNKDWNLLLTYVKYGGVTIH